MRETQGSRAVIQGLHGFWAGKRVGLLAPSFDRSTRTLATQVQRLDGIVDVFVGGSRDPGAIPAGWSAWLPQDRSTTSRGVFEAWLTNPPESLGRWLDDVDPRCELTFLGGVFTEIPSLFGRPIHGWRRPEWAAWEDKTRIDALFAEAHVPTPLHCIVTPSHSSVLEAFGRLNEGDGVILAFDSSEGYVGDAMGLRWILDTSQLLHTMATLHKGVRRLRLATFVHGVPCSILGMALRDGVAVFDPLEVVTLYNRANGALRFCGTSNRWRPTIDAVAEMRDATRRAGERLAEHCGYRGFYSVDGLMTPGGFVATELNPRHASGLGLNVAEPWFPDYLFQRAAQEGLDFVWHLAPEWVEDEFRRTIAARPSHRVSFGISAVDEGLHTWQVSVGGTDHLVVAEVSGNSLVLISLEPVPQRMGPITAALARFFGLGTWDAGYCLREAPCL